MRFPLKAKTSVVLKGATVQPGEVFDAGSKKEREFFLSVDAAEEVVTQKAAPAADDSAALLERIAAAQSIEELEALIDEGEMRKEIIAAATARWSELSAQEQG